VYEYFDFPATSMGLRQSSTCHEHEQKGEEKEDGWVSDDRVRTTTRNEYIKKNQ
jgi:hypothetical protein